MGQYKTFFSKYKVETHLFFLYKVLYYYYYYYIEGIKITGCQQVPTEDLNWFLVE